MPDLERIQQSTPGTLSQQWTEDGAAIDPGAVTIGIDRWDGTVLVAAGTATAGTGTAARTFNLTTTHTALLDRLTVTWTSPTKGTLTSYVEVVGGFLFGTSEARALKPLDDTVTYTVAKIADARIYAEDKLERECGMAFVPRYERVTVSGNGSYSLCLRYPTRSIRAVGVIDSSGTVTAFTAGELAALRTDGVSVYNPAGWTHGIGNIVIGYEHGHDSPPAGAREAALLLAKQKAVRGPVDDRATQRPTEFGPINLATAGMFGSITGLPDVDEFIRATKIPAVA